MLTLLLVAAIFALVNTIIGTVIKVLAFPLYILTLGLIGLLINAFLLWLTAWITSFWSWGLRVEDFWWGVVAAIIISLINWVVRHHPPPAAEGLTAASLARAVLGHLDRRRGVQLVEHARARRRPADRPTRRPSRPSRRRPPGDARREVHVVAASAAGSAPPLDDEAARRADRRVVPAAGERGDRVVGVAHGDAQRPVADIGLDRRPNDTSVRMSYPPSSARCAVIMAPCECPNAWTTSPGSRAGRRSAATVAS